MSRDRWFLLTLLATILVALASVAGLTFLRSQAAHETFLDEERALDLIPKARIAASRADGTLVLAGGRRRRPVKIFVPLAKLVPDRTHLLVARLGARGDLAISVRDSGASQRRWRFPTLPEEAQHLRSLEPQGSAGRLVLKLLNRGPEDLEIPALYLAPLSPALARWRLATGALGGLAVIGFALLHRRRLFGALFQPTRLDDVVFALGVLGLAWLSFHSAPVTQVLDTRGLSAVSHYFLRNGSIHLPPDFEPDWPGYQLRWINGQRMHYASPAPAVLDAPTVALYESFGVSPVTSDGRFRLPNELRIFRFQAALLAAALCAVLYLIARRRNLVPAHALALAAAFAAGTQILSTISRPYWTHAWGALLTACALLLLISPWRRREQLSMALAATCASWVFYCRPPAVFSVAGLIALGLLLQRGRNRLVFLAVGSVWAGLLVLLSLRIYGSILPPYMLGFHLSRGRFDPARLDAFVYLNNVLGSYFSPARGLFVYVPILLVILWLVLTRWRYLPAKPLAVTALAVFAAHTWLLVHTAAWPSGASYGPRQFSDVIVWLFLLAVLAVESLLAAPRSGSRLRRSLELSTAGILLALSVFINSQGALFQATWRWNYLSKTPGWAAADSEPLLHPPWAWNWRHPQFLAGWLANPPGQSDEAHEAEVPHR